VYVFGLFVDNIIYNGILCFQMAKAFVDNLKLYQAGEPMQFVVDWKKGY
jgi:hypothetical protein